MPKQRIFKTKTFNKWMIKTDLSDSDIQSAVKEMKNGLIDANLGGNVFKKRVALMAEVKVVVLEPLLHPGCQITGFLCMALIRMRNQM